MVAKGAELMRHSGILWIILYSSLYWNLRQWYPWSTLERRISSFISCPNHRSHTKRISVLCSSTVTMMNKDISIPVHLLQKYIECMILFSQESKITFTKYSWKLYPSCSWPAVVHWSKIFYNPCVKYFLSDWTVSFFFFPVYFFLNFSLK